MEQEYPSNIEEWTLDQLAAHVAENGGSEVGDVAISLVQRGMSPLEVAQRIQPGNAYGLVAGLAPLYDSTTATTIEQLLDALLTRVDINQANDTSYEVWDESPDQTKTLLGEVALALEPGLVHFLLRRGADPHVSRAEALGAALYATSPMHNPVGQWRRAASKARQIVVLLLQYGLLPQLLRKGQVQYLFAGNGGLALLRLPASVRRQLPGLDATALRAAGAALTAAAGRNLARYLAAAL